MEQVGKKMKNAKYLNESGFTLLEMLFAFSIFLIIVSLLPLSYRIILEDKMIESRIQRLEWEVFISQIKKEVRTSSKVTVFNQVLVLEKDGQTIIYERYGTNIRRRVDSKGHEILLQNVSSFKFEKMINGVCLYVTDKYGYEYLVRFRAFIKIEVI